MLRRFFAGEEGWRRVQYLVLLLMLVMIVVFFIVILSGERAVTDFGAINSGLGGE